MKRIILLSILIIFSISAISYSASPKDEFIASCKKVGDRDSDIYTKALMKNPDKFQNKSVHIRGLIAKIEEVDGISVINLYINNDYDIAIITHEGELDLYGGDWTDIYGIVKGRIDGPNGLGQESYWPHIYAYFADRVKQ